MAAQNRTVAGRQFRTKADYEAAQRDQRKIEIIKSKFDLNNKDDILELYAEMQQGAYHFETMVGNDFDDEVYELAMQFKRDNESPGNQSAQQNKEKSRKKKSSRGDAVQNKKDAGKRKADRKKSHKAIKGDGQLRLSDFDEEMQREIKAQLLAREKRRKWILAACSLVAVICFGYFGIYYYFLERTTADYEQLAELKNSNLLARKEQQISIQGNFGSEELPDILEEYQTLYNKNKKLIGWLKIDDTIIDYPVMQTSNNEYYLDHNFNQEYDKNGSIFMDFQCKAYPRSQNLILYGHHMKSGKMFGDLQKYSQKSYYEKHKIIQFDTIFEKGTYEVMYVFRTKVYMSNEIAFKYYQFFNANSEEEYDSNLKEMEEMSLYETGVTAMYGDELLTLSTCDNSQTDGRFVVVAKKIS